MPLFTGTPSSPYDLSAVLRLCTSGARIRPKSIRMAFPYATHAGFERILGELDSPDFENVPTEWVLGIHGGVTEPRLLTALLARAQHQLDTSPVVGVCLLR